MRPWERLEPDYRRRFDWWLRRRGKAASAKEFRKWSRAEANRAFGRFGEPRTLPPEVKREWHRQVKRWRRVNLRLRQRIVRAVARLGSRYARACVWRTAGAFRLPVMDVTDLRYRREIEHYTDVAVQQLVRRCG